MNNIYDGPSDSDNDPQGQADYENEIPLSLDQTEATCDYFDHFFPADRAIGFQKTPQEVAQVFPDKSLLDKSDSCGGENFPSFEEQQAYWESDAFLVNHNGQQPHED